MSKKNNLRSIRNALGLSVIKASAKLGVSKEALYNWELGYKKPRRNNWVRLCEVYRASTTQPVFNFAKVIPSYAQNPHYPRATVRREIVSDCPSTRIRIVKEYY